MVTKRAGNLYSYFKTGKRLAVALDNINRIEGMKGLLERMLANRLEISLEGVFDIPYWLDSYDSRPEKGIYSNGTKDSTLEEAILNSTGKEYVEPSKEYCKCFLVTGYHDTYQYGDIITIDGSKYIYLDSVEGMPQELELQAEDGTLCYYYIGENYLRILLPI